MKRRLRILGTAIVIAATGLALAAPAGAATLTSGASGYSAAAGTGTATMQASLRLSGTLGSFFGSLIDPIITQDINPLLAALTGTVNGLADSALGASSSLNAATDPSQQQVTTAPGAFPTDTWPSSCQPSGSQPCYQAGSASVSGASLASVSVGAVHGYAEQVASTADATNPIFGRAQVANPQVSVLPGITSLVPLLPSAVNPLVSASAVDAKANCPNDGAVGATKPATSPSAQVSTSNVSLLGGLVTFSVLDDDLTNLVVNNVPYVDVLHLPTVTAPGGVTITPFGRDISISIPLTVNQVLTGLGLSASVVSTLNGYATSSTVSLRLVVGPNMTLTSSTASAWGLGIGVDLSGSLTFNVLDLVTAKVTVPTGIGGGNYGNLLDLRLAYTACESGIKLSGTTTKAIPPALV